MTSLRSYATELGTAHAGMPACSQDQVIQAWLGTPSESSSTRRVGKSQLL